MKKRMLITGLLIGILCLPVIAQTTPVPIVNAGFEDDKLPDGKWLTKSISGWSLLGGTSGGSYDPDQWRFHAIPEGENVAFTNVPTIYQVLDYTLLPWTHLTLSVDVGWRLDYAKSLPSYEIQLWAGDDLLASESTTSLVNGMFVTAMLAYDVLGDNPFLGEHLKIMLVKKGGIQVNFDNVRLTNDRINNNNHIVPEPSSFLLVASGIAGLGYFLRRRS